MTLKQVLLKIDDVTNNCNNVMINKPRRRPPGTRALLSPGTEFLFTVIKEASRTFSTRAPSIPRGRKSNNTK